VNAAQFSGLLACRLFILNSRNRLGALILSALLTLGSFSTAHASFDDRSAGQSMQRQSHYKTAADGISLRRIRRVGVGLLAGGPLGVGGVNLELNFTPQSAFVGGFGGGEGFQAFNLQYKNVLGGESLLPYVMFGYSRWFSNRVQSQGVSQTAPTFLRERLLSEGERQSGKFSLNLVYPGVGFQIVQTSGPYAGSSLFVEAVLLTDMEDLVAATTGTIGYQYYF
jgi:hypothetical protein